MTDIKKTLYRIEDLIALGTSLPLVAIPQLRTAVTALDGSTIPLRILKRNLEKFLSELETDLTERDERALKRAFQRMKKQHPDLLHEYRNTEKTLHLTPTV